MSDGPLKVLDLFAGIGGFSLGLERTGGFRTVAFCEIDPYCRAVLAKHWPGVPIFGDVRRLTAGDLGLGLVDVVCGGFPCQDLSVAGKGAGIDAARSGLWSELCRLIGQLRPRYAIVENVPNLLAGPPEQRGGWFGRVLGDLAEIGFDAEWHCIPAASVGAPHRRDRVWIVAYPGCPEWRPQIAGGDDANRDDTGRQETASRAAQCSETLADPTRHGGAEQAPGRAERQRAGPRGEPEPLSNTQGVGRRETNGRARSDGQLAGPDASLAGSQWEPEPDVGRVAHGVPARVDRLRALGNAVVPQVVEVIGRAILEAEGRAAA